MASSNQNPSENPPNSTDLPWPEESGVWATYDLHCHCGAIRFNMKISPPLFEEESEGKGIYTAGECACSYCERNGYLSVHPKQANVEFTRGFDDKIEYRYAAKQNPQWFCGRCGSVVATDLTSLMDMMGQERRYTVNIRMLKDFELTKVKTKRVEFMRTFGPKYTID